MSVVNPQSGESGLESAALELTFFESALKLDNFAFQNPVIFEQHIETFLVGLDLDLFFATTDARTNAVFEKAIFF